jgi:hypothetical protein
MVEIVSIDEAIRALQQAAPGSKCKIAGVNVVVAPPDGEERREYVRKYGTMSVPLLERGDAVVMTMILMDSSVGGISTHIKKELLSMEQVQDMEMDKHCAEVKRWLKKHARLQQEAEHGWP